MCTLILIYISVVNQILVSLKIWKFNYREWKNIVIHLNC